MKVRMPKHDVVKANSLIGRKAVILALLNPEEKVPEFTHRGQRFDGRAVPKLVIATKFTSYLGVQDTGVIQVTYYETKNLSYGARSFFIKGNADVLVLTGSIGKKEVDTYIEYLFKTGQNFLPRINGKTGTDPEMFIEAEGKIIPAFDFLGSKKENKTPTEYGNKVYWDGIQAEFDVTAQGCLEGVTHSIMQSMQHLLKLAKNFNSKATLSNETTILADENLLKNAKQEHIELGCMPSFNVYGHSGEIVEDARQLAIRSAGGHIHLDLNFDGTKATHDTVKDIVKAMDAILAVCCVSLFGTYDKPERRRFYGLAGEYRLPPHGLEYRTLSNAWLMHPLVAHMVLDLSRKAASFGAHGFLSRWKATEEETIRCINSCNVELARKIMKRNKDTLIKIFKSTYPGQSDSVIEAVFNGFYNGIDSFIKYPKDIAGNWELSNSSTNYVSTRKSVRSVQDSLLDGKKIA